MTDNIDWNTIGEFAKGFKEAVDAQIKAVPASISANNVVSAEASDDRVDQMVGSSKEAEFMLAATEEELFVLLGASLGTDEAGEPSEKVAPPIENFVHVAEIYAKIAERNGLSDEFKGLVPEAAKTSEIRAALADTAPTFAKLCR